MIQANSLQIPLKDESVQMCCCSPPYWGLRDYGTATWEGGKDGCDHIDGVSNSDHRGAGAGNFRSTRYLGQKKASGICKCGAKRIDNQLGLEKTPEEYIENTVTWAREVWRVLRKDGTFFLNLGDSYFGSGRGPTGENGIGNQVMRQGFSSACAQRAASCDTSDKGFVGYQDCGCLCENLCDVCRGVYRNRKFHNNDLLASMLISSLSYSIHENMESLSGHVPTSDLFLRANRILVAIEDFLHFSVPSHGRLVSFLESTPDEFSLQLLVECLLRGKSFSCLLCARSLKPDVDECVYRFHEFLKIVDCNQDTVYDDDLQGIRNQYKYRVCEYCVSSNNYTNIEPQCSLKPKDLCGIPWKVAFALQADGWYLRSAMPWVKRSAMPESCTDRPASALEYMFLLTKSGTSQYWTHRDFSGVREKPKPDWRWQHQAEGVELQEAPQDWGDMLIPCPACDGTGYENKFVNIDLFGETQTTWGSICESCKETEYIIGDVRCIKEWKRINLWQGHDYYFDMENIRKEHQGKDSSKAWNCKKDKAVGPQDRGGNSQWQQDGKMWIANPNGRNYRNTDLFYQSLEEPHGAIFCGEEMVGLDVNPYSYKEAHFATFPPKLVEPCIKAGTSEKGACPECGAPWERVVEKEKTGRGNTESKLSDGIHERSSSKSLAEKRQAYRADGMEGPPPSKTIGWQPTCSHKAEPVPCVVLDNFGGSGTTKNVADRLGRYGVMCELKMEYIEMAKKRCYREPSLF